MTYHTTYLKDYTPYPYTITNCHLEFDIYDHETIVNSTHNVLPINGSTSMTLHGVDLEKQEILIDGDAAKIIDKTSDTLTIKTPSKDFILRTKVIIYPDQNKTLEGLYQSGEMYCTQNEAEGFRRITYFPDRPDVMTIFKTTIRADYKKYPTLLSNGNCISKKTLDNGRHEVVWEDPFLKPAYLYALVAGNLSKVEDTFTTMSGRDISLHIYVDPGNENKTAHAMCSLKKSMKWDEDVYNREYDLELFMIVAVDAFNMGAMENKGLNIFNSSCVLANEEISTDDDYYRIESIIAHEYFHNWTGNRITCRDWFQLTLKEGLTVFRDQEFSSDIHSRPVQRLLDISLLRRYQFPEDDGPLSHPIKPDHYKEINNFYTSTIYDKGAEIIRMYYTLIGKDAFFKGMKTYFDTFDGQAVRTEDFAWAMQSATDFDLTPFMSWYHQAGRPVVTISQSYDTASNQWIIHCKQQFPNHPDNKPAYIPILISRLDSSGKLVHNSSDCLLFNKFEQSFELSGESDDVWTFFNQFSAPVTVSFNYTLEQKQTIICSDGDSFCRYYELYNLIQDTILASYDDDQALFDTLINSTISSITFLLKNEKDSSFLSQCLSIPDLDDCLDKRQPYDVERMFKAKEFVTNQIAKELHDQFKLKVDNCIQILNEQTGFDYELLGPRRLKYTCLFYLSFSDPEIETLLTSTYQSSPTMTDKTKSLSLMKRWNLDCFSKHSDNFYTKYNHHFTVLTKWFSLQVSSLYHNPIHHLNSLLDHPEFELTNPNKCRAVLGSFSANSRYFHASDGAGYLFMATQLQRLDQHNPIMAARLATCFESYSKCSDESKTLIRTALEPMLQSKETSRNLTEIIEKILT